MEDAIARYAVLAAEIVALANAVTMFTPNRSDNVLLDNIFRFLNLVSLNIGKNRNRDS